MLIDTHAHLNFSAFKDDADKVVKRSLENDVWLINAGAQYTSSKRAVEIAERYDNGVYAAVGLHPIHGQDGSKSIRSFPPSLLRSKSSAFDYEEYKNLAQSKKVVAIGEIGLDYKQEYVSFKEKQKEVFLQQLDLAKELALPVIFHCRMAHNDLIEILSRYSLTGVMHCFTGTWQEAEKYLKMGLYLGFNGIIFKFNVDEVIRRTPLDKILIETDCPYLTPLPAETLAKAGPLRNEPIYVKYVAERIAKIKNLDYEEITEITTQNAKKLFKI